MYEAETWVLSKADELRLGVFERKILKTSQRDIYIYIYISFGG